MHRSLRALAFAGVVSAAPLAAQAQLGPPIDDKSTVVAELVVRAFGGPPWWKVSDADTTVYVLASPGQLPAGVTFEQRLLEKRIAGANEVILAPRTEVGPSLLFANARGYALFKQLNEGGQTNLEPSLPHDLRARFVAARTRIGQPERRYGGLPPGLAGMALAGDTAFSPQTRAPARPGVDVDSLVVAIARKQGVRAAPAKGRSLNQLIGDLSKPGLPCLASVLDKIEAPPVDDIAERSAVVEAWAEGDVRPLLDRVRSGGGETVLSLNAVKEQQTAHILISTPQCLNEMPVTAGIRTHYIDDQVKALERALAKPGHAVAVLDAGSLLVTGGVLDQLRRKGFAIKTPDVD